MKLAITQFRSSCNLSSQIMQGGLLILATFFALLLAVPSIEAQIPTSGGQCPIKTPSSPIDVKKITGQWYEIEASPTFMEYPYKCISVKVPSFYEKKSEISIDAVHRMTKEISTIHKLHAKIPDTSNEKDGKIMLSLIPQSSLSSAEIMYGSHLEKEYEELPIQILATDYYNWALVWMCKKHEKAKAHTDLVWVLSRERTLSDKLYKDVLEAKQSHNLEGIKTKDTIQYGCLKQEEPSKEEDNDDD